MKSTELRIRNFLIELGNDPDPLERIFNITAIYGRDTERFIVEDDNGDIMNSSFLTGIPLTEEWLLKFGFEKDEIRFQFFKDCDEYRMKISINSFSGTLEKDSSWFVSILTGYGSQPVTIVKQYVHQLQNLYFALTGEELEIK